MDLDSPEARRLNHPFFSSSTGFSSDIFADARARTVRRRREAECRVLRR